jgi:hypothetical protein
MSDAGKVGLGLYHPAGGDNSKAGQANARDRDLKTRFFNGELVDILLHAPHDCLVVVLC